MSVFRHKEEGAEKEEEKEEEQGAEGHQVGGGASYSTTVALVLSAMR